MQTTKETGQFMQCACGMSGFGTETSNTGTFRDRTFEITSKDNSNEKHSCRFMWREEDRRSTRECLA